MTDTNYILLVEDNPNDVALTSLALRKHAANVEIRVARDGEEALRMLGPIDIQGCTRGGSGVEMPNGKALRADRGAV